MYYISGNVVLCMLATDLKGKRLSSYTFEAQAKSIGITYKNLNEY